MGEGPGAVAGPCWGRSPLGIAPLPSPSSFFSPSSPPPRSCRSAVLEAHVFWRFVGTMMCVAAVFAVLVVCRQRVLDRKALEKVRKQIESI